MSPSRRLQPVVHHAESQESLRQKDLAVAAEGLRATEEQLAQLLEYRRTYTSSTANGPDAALGSVSWRDRHVFLTRLNAAVSQQQQLVDEHSRRVERARQAWIESRVRTQSLQKVVQKRASRERVLQDRREQNAVDESNCAQAARRKSPR